MSCEGSCSYWILTRWKMLTTWWPGCSHDISCHNSKNWPQRNENKLTPELKVNCTLIKMTPITPPYDQFQDDCPSWLRCFYRQPPSSTYKRSFLLVVSPRGPPLDRSLHHPPPSPTPLPASKIEIKQPFLSTNLASSLTLEPGIPLPATAFGARVRLLRSRDIWLPGFWSRAAAMTAPGQGCDESAAGDELEPRGGFGGCS